MSGDFKVNPQAITPAMIKCLPDYRLDKITLVKKLFTLQGAYEEMVVKETEATSLIDSLTKQLAEKNNKEVHDNNSIMGVAEHNVSFTSASGQFPIIHDFEPEPENASGEVLELKSEIEGHYKINLELQQQIETISGERDYLDKERIRLDEKQKEERAKASEFKEQNEILKEKLNRIEEVLINFRLLLNNEFSGETGFCP